MNGDKHEPQTPPPMSDEEFDAWWPFDDSDLDEFEREIEASLKDYEILPDPNWEEKKKRIEEMARRTLASKHPGRITEELRKKLPPGLLAYWRGEAPTPYTDPTGWDEFRETLTPSDDLGWLVPIDKSADTEPQSQPDLDATAADDA